ncbi:MAG TPA: pilus assembly protein [bacterium]|nr:pilus assembly protein [Candidatus Omnitrophota bacterium]HOJ61719.1 pilus assembly protein [bacterium]HOL93975.1 pilus assembly protein [bacterium]HPO99189.1 pilus assembly protein [bacterium]HXK93452.1 pilus assembly protein [bacterium]
MRNGSTFHNRSRGFRKGERGGAIIEMAVVMPILFMFLFGIVEFGRIMMVSHSLNNAARAGARVAVLPGATNAAVLAAINNELAGTGLTMNSYQLIPEDVSTANRDDPITVRVSINYDSITWVAGFFPGLSGTQLHGTVIMRKEGFG